MNIKNIGKKGVVIALAAVAMLVGAIGGTLLNGTAHAQSPTPADSVAPAPANSSGGTFKSNEDPAHEAKESAEREAQENAGQRPTVK